VAILEAMKMEINVICTDEAVGTTVEAIASQPGTVVSPGTWIVISKKEEDAAGAHSEVEKKDAAIASVDKSEPDHSVKEQDKNNRENLHAVTGKAERLSLKERFRAMLHKS